MRGLVELWRTPAGGWRWRWVDDSGGSILANRSWETIEEAHEAAARAYPGEVVVLLERPPGGSAPAPVVAGGVGRAVGLIAALALLIGIVVGIARLRALRQPTR